MKFTKTLASIAAATIAVSSLAVSAFAADALVSMTVPEDSKPQMQVRLIYGSFPLMTALKHGQARLIRQ